MPLSFGPPDENLGRELRQVASAAYEVAATLGSLNAVPPDFPKASLLDLCAALGNLPEGTAENCRPVLELARNALPKLRREHFGIEDATRDTPVEDGAPPRFTRDMLMDQQLKNLLATVTTALDEYRVQAGMARDDEMQPSDVAVPTTPIRGMGVQDQAGAVVARLDDGTRALDAKGAARTREGDLLRRSFKDGATLALAASSQLRERSIVRRWFEGVVAAFRKTPDLIEAAGNGLQRSAHAGEPLGRWLANFLTEWIPTTIRQAKELGVALQEAARRLRGNEIPSPASPGGSEDRDRAELARLGLPVSDDPDWRDGLRIETTLAFSAESFRHGAAALERLAPRVTTVFLVGAGLEVELPASLARFSTLRALNLSHTDVADVGPLAGLTTLRRLDLRRTGVADVGPLAGLTALQTLNLSGTPVADVRPLAGLKALQSLHLSDTGVADVGPLAGLTALQSLNLSHTRVANAGPLAGLKALQSLELSSQGMADVEPLAGLTALQSLNLAHTRVADVGPLAGLKALRSLRLTRTGVTDVGPLAGLTALQTLELSSTGVNDVGPLAGLTALRSLDLSGTRVADVGPLAGLTALQTLELSFTRVADVGPLARLMALQTLKLSFTGVADIAPLLPLPKLRALTVGGAITLEAKAAFDQARQELGLPAVFRD